MTAALLRNRFLRYAGLAVGWTLLALFAGAAVAGCVVYPAWVLIRAAIAIVGAVT